MSEEFIQQREEGLEFLTEALISQGYKIKERPLGLKPRENYHEGIYKQMSRDILIEDAEGIEYLVSYNTQAFPIIEFIQKLIASAQMDIVFVPVLRKSIEPEKPHQVYRKEEKKLVYQGDGNFFVRTLSRKSMSDMDKRLRYTTIDSKNTERLLVRPATVNCVPYIQPETENHKQSLRIYTLRKPLLDHRYTGMPFAWEKGEHKSKKFLEAMLQNPIDSTRFNVMPVHMAQKEVTRAKKLYLKVLQYLHDNELSPHAEQVIPELRNLKRFHTGILVPDRLDYRNGFPLLFLNLRFMIQQGRIDQVDSLRTSIEERVRNIKPENPFAKYELKQYGYHNQALQEIKQSHH